MRISSLARTMLKRQTGLGKNILWVIVSRFGAQGLAVLFTLVLARRLGSAVFGAYALIAAIVFIGNALTTFGMDMVLIRDIAGRDDHAQLFPALVIQLVLSGVFIGIVWAGAPFLPNQSPDSILGLKIYILALLPLAFFSIFTTVLRGRQRMDSYMVLNCSLSALQFAAVWALVHIGSSITWLAEVLLLVQCAGAVMGGILCGIQIPEFWSGWRFSWRQTAALVRACAPIALIALAAMLYQKISVYMISALVGPTPTGLFSAAQRVIEAAKTIHLAVFTALYPAMAELSKTNLAPGETSDQWNKPWRGPFWQSWNLLIIGAIVAALGIFLAASPLTQILYGSQYRPAVSGLRILGFILIPFTWNTFYSLAMLANHKEQVVLRVQFAGLVTLIGLNAWWIPRWGVEGACLAFVAAEAVQSILYLLSANIRRSWQGILYQAIFTKRAGVEDQDQRMSLINQEKAHEFPKLLK